MPPLFLTLKEMVVLTGRRPHKLQIDALGAMGVRFLVNALGRAVVTRAAVEARILTSTPPAAPLLPAAPAPITRAYPKGMRARHLGSRVYYYLDTGATPRREIKLGKDYDLAVKEWARLTGRQYRPLP